MAANDVTTSYYAVCRQHELLREQVWKIRMLLILTLLSEMVISHFYSTNVNNLTWRQQEICTQLARAWESSAE